MSLLQLVDGLDLGTTRHYKPGQGERYPVSAYLDGVLDDTTTPVLTVHGPDGATSTPAVVHDSQGQYHADYALPAAATDGVWIARWSATGGTPSADACIERRFIVDALDF